MAVSFGKRLHGRLEHRDPAAPVAGVEEGATLKPREDRLGRVLLAGIAGKAGGAAVLLRFEQNGDASDLQVAVSRLHRQRERVARGGVHQQARILLVLRERGGHARLVFDDLLERSDRALQVLGRRVAPARAPGVLRAEFGFWLRTRVSDCTALSGEPARMYKRPSVKKSSASAVTVEPAAARSR